VLILALLDTIKNKVLSVVMSVTNVTLNVPLVTMDLFSDVLLVHTQLN
jgi:hypothetical protein